MTGNAIGTRTNQPKHQFLNAFDPRKVNSTFHKHKTAVTQNHRSPYTYSMIPTRKNRFRRKLNGLREQENGRAFQFGHRIHE